MESFFKPFYADRLTGTMFAKYPTINLSVASSKTPLAQVTESVNHHYQQKQPWRSTRHPRR